MRITSKCLVHAAKLIPFDDSCCNVELCGDVKLKSLHVGKFSDVKVSGLAWPAGLHCCSYITLHHVHKHTDRHVLEGEFQSSALRFQKSCQQLEKPLGLSWELLEI